MIQVMRIAQVTRRMKRSDEEYKNNDDDAGTVVNIFKELLSERSVHAYPCLEDFDPIVEMYERRSGNHMGITHNEKKCISTLHVQGAC